MKTKSIAAIVIALAATPVAIPNANASRLGNISTRAFVQTGDNVMIGGFIVQGTGPKTVILRAIGPELSAPPYNIPNALADPTLELHNGIGTLIASNNNWQTTIIGGIITTNQVSAIQNSGHAPTQPSESAIIATLQPGNYTAIVRGANNTTGVALVEVYDIDGQVSSILGNVSTRAFVQTADNVMIGGFIVQGTGQKSVIVRAIGPELSAPPFNIPNALGNPTLELHNGSGALIASNDNWQTTIIGGIITSSQVSAIQNSGHAPTQASESAIIATLPAGNYTAIVRGVNNTTGIALVEVYDLTPISTATPTPTPTCVPVCTPGTWMQAGQLPIDLYGPGADTDGTNIYAAGGYNFSLGGDLATFYRSTNGGMTWGTLAPIPAGTTLPGLVYAPNVNKLFMFGGANNTTGTVYNTTRIYDIATNTWTTGAIMPGPRHQMAAGYYNGKIYLAAGHTTVSQGSDSNAIWEYDPVANTWNTSRANMPASLGGPGYGIINGHLYVAGGRNMGSTNLNTLYDYNIATNTWTQRANLPAGVNAPGSTVICGKLWVFGGGNPFLVSNALPESGKKEVQVPDTTNVLQIYDPATNTWSTGPGLNQQRSFPGGTHLGNTALAIGGYTGSTTTTSVEINVTTSGCGP